MAGEIGTAPLLNERTVGMSQRGSPIRLMFETGNRLAKQYGRENVFDFSLGNPALEPPEAFTKALARLASNPPPSLHAYPPNRGIMPCIEACAKRVSEMHPPTVVPQECVCVTCGAAGAINILFKTICSRGEEIITFAPYFCEYLFYAESLDCTLKVLPSAERTFEPDLAALRAAVSEKTRVVLINSPNNPSGKILSQATVDEIGKVCAEATKKYGKACWLVSDEPYSKIVYGNPPPKVANIYATPTPHAVVVTSFSKDLSIPGERIGYLALSPRCGTPEAINAMMGALTFWQRVMGFVNSAVIMQHAIAECPDASVDVSWYDARRKAICNGLRAAGLELIDPEGAFYAFPKVPEGVPEDEYCKALADKCVLAVPGSAFGMPGYLRFSYAVKSLEAIERAVVIIKEVTKPFLERRKK